jgi:hypothetical protein
MGDGDAIVLTLKIFLSSCARMNPGGRIASRNPFFRDHCLITDQLLATNPLMVWLQTIVSRTLFLCESEKLRTH